MNKYLSLVTKNEIYQKYQLILFPIISAAISLILLFLIIIPQFLKFFNDSKLITEANQRFDLLNKKVDLLNQVDSSLYQGNIDTSFIALPPDQDVPNALGQVIFLVSSNKLQLSNISVSNPSGGVTPKISNYQIKLEVSGDANSLKNFISSLKQSPRIMKVSNIELTQERVTGRIQASLSLQAYYQGLPQTLGDVEQPINTPTAQEISLLHQIDQYAKSIPSVTGTTQIETKGKADPFQ